MNNSALYKKKSSSFDYIEFYREDVPETSFAGQWRKKHEEIIEKRRESAQNIREVMINGEHCNKFKTDITVINGNSNYRGEEKEEEIKQTIKNIFHSFLNRTLLHRYGKNYYNGYFLNSRLNNYNYNFVSNNNINNESNVDNINDYPLFVILSREYIENYISHNQYIIILVAKKNIHQINDLFRSIVNIFVDEIWHFSSLYRNYISMNYSFPNTLKFNSELASHISNRVLDRIKTKISILEREERLMNIKHIEELNTIPTHEILFPDHTQIRVRTNKNKKRYNLKKFNEEEEEKIVKFPELYSFDNPSWLPFPHHH